MLFNVAFSQSLLSLLFTSSPTVDLRPYKVYTALLSQSSTNNPTATIFENTIGNIVWSREASGYYKGTLANSFPSNKTIVFVSAPYSKFADWNADDYSINAISVSVLNKLGAEADGWIMSIEIRVYN